MPTSPEQIHQISVKNLQKKPLSSAECHSNVCAEEQRQMSLAGRVYLLSVNRTYKKADYSGVLDALGLTELILDDSDLLAVLANEDVVHQGRLACASVQNLSFMETCAL